MSAKDSSKSTSSTSTKPNRVLASRWVLITLITITLLIVASIFLARPMLKRWNNRSARELVAEAENLGKEGRWEQASAQMNKAFMKDPGEPAVLRSIAQFLKMAGGDQERTLYFWRQLVNTGTATLQDRAAMGESFILAGQSAEARKVLEALPAADRQTRHAMELEANLLKVEGKPGEAETLLRKALQMEPENPECLLKLASLDLSNPFSEVQSRALNILWTVARGESPEALTAIQLLAADSRLSSTQASELMELVEKKNTPTTQKLRYIVLNSYVRLRPLEREAILQKEAKAREAQPLDEAQDYLRWLYGLKEYDRLIALLPKEKATRMPEIFPIYVEALAAKERWAELREIMRTSATLPISATDMSLLQARCANAFKESSTIIKGHLEEACRRALAARDMPNMLRSASIAENMGFDEVSVEAYRSAVALPQYQLSMLERILAIHVKQRNSDAMLTTLRDITAAKPGLRLHQENIFYIKLLVGQEMETTPLAAATMVKEGKIASIAFHLLQALAAYRGSDLETVRTQLAEIDPGNLSVGQRAVFAGMLSATGDKAKAYAIAEKLAANLLLNEELKFLRLAL